MLENFYEELANACREMRQDQDNKVKIKETGDLFYHLMELSMMLRKDEKAGMEAYINNLPDSVFKPWLQEHVEYYLCENFYYDYEEVALAKYISNGFHSYDALICLYNT